MGRRTTDSRWLWLWLPAALATPVARELSLDQEGRERLAAAVGQAASSGDMPTMSPWEALSFHRGDAIVVWLVVPLALLALSRWLRPAWMAVVTVLASSIAILLLYTETEFIRQIGRFQSIELIIDACLWGSDNPHLAGQFISPWPFVAIGGGIVGLIIAGWWMARRANAEVGLASQPNRGVSRVTAAILGVATAAAAALWFIPTSTINWHKSLYHLYLDDYVGWSVPNDLVAANTPAALRARYEALTAAPSPRPSEHFAAAPDADVVLFVMETGPARCLPVDDALADMPNVRKLRERSFVARRHHTTYPYTSRAVFSLLSSWYPSRAGLDYIEQLPAMRLPGLVQALRGRGYTSGVYLPLPLSFGSDRRMLTSLGFERQVVAELTTDEARRRHAADPVWRVQAALDESALAAMKRDLESNLAAERRSVTLFLPQFGHAPWFDLDESPGSGRPHGETFARGRAIVALQDRWLGEIVALLQRHGRLEKSIIVVTADHGLRNRAEAPELPVGTLAADTFQVPLLIFAPRALQTRHDIDAVTSHIDIAPSVLDLLGVREGRETEQGSPIWDRRLAARTTFFFADHYNGLDGFHRAGRFAMRHHVSGIAAAHDAMRLRPRDVIADRAAADDVRDQLDAMSRLQNAWVRQLSP